MKTNEQANFRACLFFEPTVLFVIAVNKVSNTICLDYFNRILAIHGIKCEIGIPTVTIKLYSIV